MIIHKNIIIMGLTYNLLLLLALGLSAVSGRHHNHRQSHDFDLLIFTQSWPQTVCHEWQEKNPSHECNLPNDGGWSIHGIWPTKFHTIGPTFCNKTWHFDPELIKPIEAELEQEWINVEKGTSTFSLWTHEWSKHGTCAAVLPQLSDESKYFSQGLKWLEQYSMTTILNSAGIYPSMDTEYKLIDLYNAVKMYLGKNPAVECKREANNNLMAEIRICFDKNLELNDCDGIVSLSGSNYEQSPISNCDINKSILYPNVVPTKFNSTKTIKNLSLVQLYKFVNLIQWITL